MPCIHDGMFDWSVDKASSPGSFPCSVSVYIMYAEKCMMNSVGVGMRQ